jgi:NADP-dependent 3-hydroxy acid dehydrogenase YdfG
MEKHVVLITGGGSGIGRASAVQFAREGHEVLVVGRRAAPLEETARASERITSLVADVCRESDLATIIDAVTQRWGRLDVLVNNAGAFAQRSLEDSDAELVTSISPVRLGIRRRR